MGRPKEFDETEALMKAMQLFWVHGYKATSIQDLVDGMGIGRGSLYGTFGGKRSLFMRALRHYDREREEQLVQFAEEKEPCEAVLATFEGVVDSVLSDGGRDGCFLVNTALELSAHDAEIASVVASGFADSESFYRMMIERGKASKAIPKDVDAPATARALLTLLLGLFVLSRSRPEAVLLRSVVKQADAMIHGANGSTPPR